MTIRLYESRKFQGKSLVINRNYRTSGDTAPGKNPSSLTMTGSGDAILLFKKEDWDGGATHRRGKRNMTSLGKTSQGGEFLSGNTVASVRVTPFTLKLNVNVVTKLADPESWRTSGYGYPGDMPGEASVESAFGKAVLIANSFFQRERAMIDLRVARYRYRYDDAKFDMTEWEAGSFPPDWKSPPGEVDVIVCNTITHAYGLAEPPWSGKLVIVEMLDRSIDQIARALAHGIGHHLGLSHGSGDGAAANIMTPSIRGRAIDESVLTPEQVEEMQRKLARNPTRQGDRVE
jgi:hypothetical protein